MIKTNATSLASHLVSRRDVSQQFEKDNTQWLCDKQLSELDHQPPGTFQGEMETDHVHEVEEGTFTSKTPLGKRRRLAPHSPHADGVKKIYIKNKIERNK